MKVASVRKARPEEAFLLPAIEQSAGELFRGLGDLSWIADEDNMSVERHLELIRAGTSWVAAGSDGQPAGFLCAMLLPATLHIVELAVCLESQRQGVGRCLMEHVICWAYSHRLSSITLTTFRDLPWNGPFYCSLGFRVLSAQQIDSRLGRILREEAVNGMSPHRRCAMRLDLNGWPSSPRSR